MTQVRCIECGNVQDTFARWVFSCKQCGKKQEIINSIIEDEIKKEKPQKPIEKEIETPIEEKTLEVEEDQTPEEKKEEKFFCPQCGAKIKKFEDCSNCGAEIIWSEE